MAKFKYNDFDISEFLQYMKYKAEKKRSKKRRKNKGGNKK